MIKGNPPSAPKPDIEITRKNQETYENEPTKKQEQPFKITWPFLKEKPLLGKERPLEKPIEPMLLLLKQDGFNEFLGGIKPGEFVLKTPEGLKSIWLTPEKIRTFKYGKQYIRGWVADENCMTPLPEDPLYGSELQKKIVQKLALNYKDVNEVKLQQALNKRWLYILLGIALIILIIFSTGGDAFIMNLIQGTAETTATPPPIPIETAATPLNTSPGNTSPLIQIT